MLSCFFKFLFYLLYFFIKQDLLPDFACFAVFVKSYTYTALVL